MPVLSAFLRLKQYAAGLTAALLMIAIGSLMSASASKQTAGQCHNPFDPNRWALTFSEEFDRLDVSAWGPDTRWIAHTPWAGDFGKSRFADPVTGFPFLVKEGVLRIEARKDNDGSWKSGLLASVDKQGNGFSQQFGYFEIKTKLPTSEGLWPAFWLIGLDRSKYTAEIDILEYYPGSSERYSSTVHVWRKKGPHKSRYNRNFVFNAKSRPDVFHTYAARVEPDWTTFYFDRCPVWRTPTMLEHHQPMYVLLNLALGGGKQSIEKTLSPSYMFVDYVRVWRPPE